MTKVKVKFQLKTQVAVEMLMLATLPVLAYSSLTLMDTTALFFVLIGSSIFAVICIMFLNWEFTRKINETGQIISACEGKKIEVNPSFREFGRILDVINHKTDRASEELELVRGILNNLPVGVIATDEQGHIAFVNDTISQLMGYEPKELVGKGYGYLRTLTNPEPFDKTLSPGKQWAEGKKISDYRMRIFRKDGLPVSVEVNVFPFCDQAGKNRGSLSVMRDLSLEIELSQIQERVNEQEKLAVVGQMAAGMAHELRNPLTTVRGFIQLVHGKMLKNDDTREYFELIMQEIDRTNEIIRDFLLLAKPKPPSLTLHPVNHLVEELLPLLESQCLLHNIKVNKQFAPFVPPAVLDPDQIKQVLLNLMQNALQAMEGEEHGVLTLSTSFDKVNKMVVISVGDTGRGISPEHMGKLSTPFFTTKDHGTGLGLSVSYRIIEAHRGRILVDSEVGKGSTFQLCIPAGYL